MVARATGTWWRANQDEMRRLENLVVLSILPEAAQALGRLAQRNMRLQCNIQEGVVSAIDDEQMVEVQVSWLFPEGGARF